MPYAVTGRPEAASLAWNWRGNEDLAKPAEDRGNPRLRGTLQGLVGLSIGATVFTFLSQTVGNVICAIAGVITLSALLSPRGLYFAIERVFAALGRLVGRGLTWLLMPAIFYLFFLPFSLLFRRGRRDSMTRFLDPDVTSYWSHREQRSGSGLPYHQY